MFVNIPGVTAPAPFGGNARTIIVNVNPELMHSYGMSAEEVTLAITHNNMPSPAGNITIGDQNLMSPVNSLIYGPEELLNIPIRTTNCHSIFITDIATVVDAADFSKGDAVITEQRPV